MATGWIGRMVAGLAALALSGCAVTLVPAYDARIDEGVSALYTDTIRFVDRTTALAGTPEGDYAHNRDFYDGADARIATLIVRGEANRVSRSCPTSRVATLALDVAHVPVAMRGSAGAAAGDDCEVVLLRSIRTGFDDMRHFHEAQGPRGLPPSARGPLLDGGVGAQLRAAITVEIAKRTK